MTSSSITFVFADPYTVAQPHSDGLHTVFRNWYWGYYPRWGIMLYWFPSRPHYAPCANTILSAVQSLTREEHSLLGDSLSVSRVPLVVLPCNPEGDITQIPDRTGEIWIPGGDDPITVMTHRIRPLSYDWRPPQLNDAEKET